VKGALSQSREKIKETHYRYKILDVELNLAALAKEDAQWVSSDCYL
jgi:hypothetical protein